MTDLDTNLKIKNYNWSLNW